MATKQGRFDLDWWIIEKRQIYFIITLLVLSVLGGGAGLYVWVYGTPFKTSATVAEAPAGARFISFEGDVRVIRAATRETIAARSQTQLYPGDTVQTQADGRARISLADGSTLVVRPNSTVIIRENTRVEGEQRTQVRVAVDTGQINVRTEQQPDGASNVVETRQTQSRLAGDTGASFGVNADKTEEIRVATGQLETVTANGDKTIVRNGEYLSINQSGTLARRERLLDVPPPVAPRNLERVQAGTTGAASVALRWERPTSGTPAHYRVEVATSPFFVAAGRVIERDQLISTEFNASDLRPGDYFWRVRATASSGQTSDWCEPQKFIVSPPGRGERVSVSDLSFDFIGGQIYIVRGRAPRGTTIRIAERETFANADGSFQLQITIPAGAREIVLEAQDPQGNSEQYRVPVGSGSPHQKK
ncbi:MAG TPA: FecR domain-containing protein [Pyrinomonadaceae bacterium]|jgi:hypothetical protein|nr:FecR domain-containing protein [Pyrinomonadaceae bacterium]